MQRVVTLVEDRNRSTHVNRCEITPASLLDVRPPGLRLENVSVSIIVVVRRVSSQYVREAGRAQLWVLFCPAETETERPDGRARRGRRRRGGGGRQTRRGEELGPDLSADWQTLTYILHAVHDIFIGISIHHR